MISSDGVYHGERAFSPVLGSTSDLEVSIGFSTAEPTRHPQGPGQLPLLTEYYSRTLAVLGRAAYFADIVVEEFWACCSQGKATKGDGYECVLTKRFEVGLGVSTRSAEMV